MGYLHDALSMDNTLGKKAQQRRTIFFFFAVVALPFVLSGTVLTLQQQMESQIMLVGYVGILFFYPTVIIMVLCKRALPPAFVANSLMLLSFVVLVADLNGRTVLTPNWPLQVAILDLMLVMDVPSMYPVAVVVCTVIWFAIMACEETFRFGLLDLPGLRPQGGEYGRRAYFDALTDCEELPCAVDFPESFISSCSMLTIDFLVTRGFARDAAAEQASMERTINVVQEIAGLLAGYDVEGVARMLDSETQLPQGMHASLKQMERNLRKYRPYLPAALFEEADEADTQTAQNMSVAPGVVSEVATVVFTDIRSSTWIWQHAPDGMHAALRIHNTIMRATMLSFGGYEVKTIGDAFMVAFSSTQHGIEFGLRVHELLREADWPASLLENAPICAKQGALWCGLTVRIGVNSGPVSIDSSTLTGRIDYFGHTVNVASRLESICTPGAVAVRTDLWSAECGAISAVVGASEALDLKGVSGTTFVCCVWPLSLAGRKQRPLVAANTLNIELPRNISNCSSVGNASRASSTNSLGGVPLAESACFPLTPARCFEATLGVLEVDVGEEGNTAVMQTMSNALSTLTVALDQSCGTVVAMLGNRVHVGWNLTRSAPAHTENAIRFAQRALSGVPLAGMAVVSGTVQHGTVGARKQRFVTVMGATVHRSSALCDEAVRVGVRCLYEPPQHATLPVTLQNVTKPIKGRSGLYEVAPLTARDSVY